MNSFWGKIFALRDFQLSNKKALIILLLINIIFFIPFIIALPDHYLDDFVVFGVINSHPNNFISLNPTDPYFLFLRPVSYLSFWIDYKLFPMMPILMKFETLLIHLVLVTAVYYLLIELKKYFKLEISNSWIFLVTLVYSIYPDNYKWITWITNRTELLMMLFYILSLFYALKYLNNPIRKFSYLLLHFFFFLLSIASKQQPLHMPFLIMTLIWLKSHSKNVFSNKYLPVILTLEIISMIIYSIVNVSMYQTDSLIFIQSLWKKPFSIFGNILMVINPYYGDLAYVYFLNNKLIAVFSFLVIVVIVSYLLYKSKNYKLFISIILIYLIISFPRIFAASASRINSIQVLFLIIILFSIIIFNKKKIFIIGLLLLIPLNLITIIQFYNIDKYYTESYNKRINELLSIYTDKSFILVNKDPLVLSCQYYFLKEKDYKYKFLNMAPIIFTQLLNRNYTDEVPRISVLRLNNVITINAMNEFIYMVINPAETPNYYFNPKNLQVSYGISGRGYSKISFELHDEMKNKKLIYHDGVDWRVVTQL